MLPTQDSLVANFPTNLCNADSVILLSNEDLSNGSNNQLLCP